MKVELDNGAFASRPAGLPNSRRAAGFLPRIHARLRRVTLDKALATGCDPSSSPALAARAARLTSKRTRLELADSLDRTLASGRARPRVPTAAIAPNRQEVSAAASGLTEVSAILRSGEPVYAEGMAMLMRLLTDGGSNIFMPTHTGALGEEMSAITSALQGRERII